MRGARGEKRIVKKRILEKRRKVNTRDEMWIEEKRKKQRRGEEKKSE